MNAPAEQRTEEWRQERAGNLTASTFKDIIAVKRDGKPTEARAKLMRVKAFERLAGIAQHEVGSKSMDWGKDLEDAADEAYMVTHGGIIVPSPYLTHSQYSYIGASPDGLVGTDGGVEKKCPHDEAVHIQTWLEGMPADHMPQVQGNMLVTGRQWWDFISYDPRQAPELRLYVQRVPRDDDYIKTLLTALLQFEAELRAMVETLRRKAA
ncbi:lambda exonuclease family protein [Achromobacter ruhlandii]|uniref:lambda exonuclease family protein n=1 Tax=Achromobacter ruhlandii TaxID=72557 RepID=UPI0007BFA08E|nr:lambda exonuclease family protein [Achromobacter ruhlandii]